MASTASYFRTSTEQSKGPIATEKEPIKSVTGLLMEHYHLKGHLYKLGMVDNLTCSRCLKCNGATLHMLCYCKVLAELQYHHFRTNMLKLTDYHEALINKLLQHIQDAGLLLG